MLPATATIRLRALLVMAVLSACALFSPAQCGAQDVTGDLTREQVLHGLEDSDPDVRRGAYIALGGVGIREDLPLLYSALYDADPLVRKLAEDAIWKVWSRSGNALHDRILQRGVEQMQAGHYAAAVRSFSALIRLAPGFAEAWNKRATVYFIVGEDDRSIADVEAVLEREPYHFGALSGYGHLMLRKREYRRALGYFERALTVHPNMRDVSKSIDSIRRALEEGGDDAI
jgi:tetratricopeptide (TPR) repeat protein